MKIPWVWKQFSTDKSNSRQYRLMVLTHPPICLLTCSLQFVNPLRSAWPAVLSPSPTVFELTGHFQNSFMNYWKLQRYEFPQKSFTTSNWTEETFWKLRYILQDFGTHGLGTQRNEHSHEHTWTFHYKIQAGGYHPTVVSKGFSDMNLHVCIFSTCLRNPHHPPNRAASGRGQADNLCSNYCGKLRIMETKASCVSPEQF